MCQVELFISDNESNAKFIIDAPTIGIEKMVVTPKDKQKSLPRNLYSLMWYVLFNP